MKDHTSIEVSSMVNEFEVNLNSTFAAPGVFDSHIRKYLNPEDLANLTLVSTGFNDTLNPTMRSTAFTLFKENKILLTENQAVVQSARSKVRGLCPLAFGSLALTSVCLTAFISTLADSKDKEDGVKSADGAEIFPALSPYAYLGAGVFFFIATVATCFKAKSLYAQVKQSVLDSGLADAGDLPKGDLEVLGTEFKVVDDCLINQGEQYNTDIRRQIETGKLHTNDLEEGLLEDHDGLPMTPG